ncbi:aldose epimerase family protein [Sorangium sp. So ce1182]|uniref:aldose epimerase family protein n=1 Tax=Sorangium sp. So ce1182 TaxID=3133334 RepID=UPI003F627146
MRARTWIVAGNAVLCGCGESEELSPIGTRELSESYFEISREDFQGVVDGKAVDLYTIENSKGAFAKITNLGAKIEQLVVADKAGRLGDVVLGYPSLDAVRTGQASMGAFIGRYASRIAGGTFTVDGTEHTGGSFVLAGRSFTLPANDGARPNTSHGGPLGSRFRVFDAVQLSRSSVQMSLTFDDSEEAAPGFTGFPGTVSLEVVYTLTEQDALSVRYRATALDEATVVNFTSHPFFNLSNTPGSPVAEHELTINAEQFLELDELLVPTGVLRSVDGTPLDFRSGKPVGAHIGDVSYDMLARIDPTRGGYDHTFVIVQPTPGTLTLHATVHEPGSGRALDVWSTEPGLHLFTANGLNGGAPRDVGKGNVPYPSRSALCLEPMHFPDSPNQPSFPSTELAAGATYEGEIVFAFSTR